MCLGVWMTIKREDAQAHWVDAGKRRCDVQVYEAMPRSQIP